MLALPCTRRLSLLGSSARNHLKYLRLLAKVTIVASPAQVEGCKSVQQLECWELVVTTDDSHCRRSPRLNAVFYLTLIRTFDIGGLACEAKSALPSTSKMYVVAVCICVSVTRIN
jgi:hypothetical protein